MKKITVLIVDDSAVIRNVIREVLSADEAIEVVGEAEDPLVAREMIKKLNPDVLTLDIEMPKMDGITFLRNLMRLRPMPVIMLSTFTSKGADVTLEALAIGAIDFIEKPSFEQLMSNQHSFKAELTKKVKLAIAAGVKNQQLNKALAHKESISCIPFSGTKSPNHLIAIGASTGGTEAIKELLLSFPHNAPPVVIALHIPKAFSRSYAERLNNMCNVIVHEAEDGMKIETGHVYLAPGDLHLKVVEKQGILYCETADTEEINHHKPAVDVLFDSLLPLAKNIQAVLLTGMGQDGAQGMLRLKQLGAQTVIQSKASSLIWGMPGKAHAIDAHVKELDLTDIAQDLLDFASSGKDSGKGRLNDSK